MLGIDKRMQEIEERQLRDQATYGIPTPECRTDPNIKPATVEDYELIKKSSRALSNCGKSMSEIYFNMNGF